MLNELTQAYKGIQQVSMSDVSK